MTTSNTNTVDRVRRAQEVESDPRWTAIVARDASADGTFYFSVRTTGVYCRPSCGARRPLPENVSFHASCDGAESAGFRPCRRCEPRGASLRDRHAAKVTDACRYIESCDTPPSL